MPGRYTREGDVGALLAAVDDEFVIARPGDEVSLAFDAALKSQKKFKDVQSLLQAIYDQSHQAQR